MRSQFRYSLLTALSVTLLALQTSEAGDANQRGEAIMLLQSTAFKALGNIPKRYTCDGDNNSPPLTWLNLPANTASLVLIVDDPDAPSPDAPQRTWVHWVLYNISPSASGLVEAVSVSALPQGTLQGKNNWKKTGYRGPCPPLGRHRYFHKLYALDSVLPDLNEPNKADLEKAMAGHILDYKELIGTYQR